MMDGKNDLIELVQDGPDKGRIVNPQMAEEVAWIVKDDHEKLMKEANIDPLTGLHNRRFIEEALKKTVSRSERSGYPLAIVFMDVDDLKGTNDTRGHKAGDELLQRMAKGLKDGSRKEDDAGRWAGDEFVMIIKDCEPEKLLEVVNRLKGIINGLGVNASFGVASWEKGVGPDELLRRSDVALYAAKQDEGSVVEWRPGLPEPPSNK